MNISKLIIGLFIIHCASIAFAQSTYTPPDWFRTTRNAPLTSLATVQDILVSNYATINDGQDDLSGIQQALDLAKQTATASRPVRVVFEQGTYDLYPDGSQTHAIFFNNANSVVIEGNKANIQIHNPEVGFFSMFQSKNIIIKDLIIDYAILPFTQGTVTARNFSNNSFTLNIDNGFPLLNAAHFANASEKWGMLKQADGRLKSGVSNLLSVRSTTQTSGNQFQVFLSGNTLSQFAVNDRFVYIARNNGRTIFRSNTGENITYMGIISYASPSGSYNVFNHKEWSLINCKVLIKPGRIHSGNADIMHINGGFIGPWVEGCRFEGQSDDAINMKNTKMDILSVISPTEITGSLALTTQDTIAFYNPRDGVFLGRVGLTKAAEFISSGTYKLTLSKPIKLTNLSSANVGDKAYIETRMNESFVFINDTIRNGRRYGMLIQNGYGVVENCVFENLSNSAIRMENGVDWSEGFVANKIRIANNRFINNGFEEGYNDDPLGASITGLVSKLGNGNCNPWCGTEITDWNGLDDIWITNNYFDYNKASVNIHNYKLDDIPNLSLVAGFTSDVISLANSFDDVLGGNWTLTASSNDPTVITTSVSGKNLTISEGSNKGRALISLTATNTNGGKAYSSFYVQIVGTVFNGAEDQFWSKASNWQSGQKPSSLSAVLVEAENSFVDEAFTLTQITNNNDASNTSITGDRTITLQNTSGTNDPAILNQSDQPSRFTFNNTLIIDNITNEFTYLGIGGSLSNTLTFGPTSSLQINTRTSTYSVSNSIDRTFEFNGKLIGNNNLIFGNFTNSVFGTTASNRLFNGDLVFFADSKVKVEMHQDSVFLPQNRKIQVNGKNARLILNKPNAVRGNISIAGANDLTFEINEDQTMFDQILMAADGNVKLIIDGAVDSVFFQDNSSSGWGTGKVMIEGFRNGVLRFGTDANGLTAAQLSQLEIEGVPNFTIDENGFLFGTQTAVFIGYSSLNNLWSNADNWINGLRGDAAEYAQFNASAELDVLATVNQIRSGGEGAISDQGGRLTVTGKGYTAAVLQNGGDGATFNVDAKVIIDSSDDLENLQVNGTNGILTFGPNAELTLKSKARLNADGTLNRRVNMNGKLIGDATLEIAASCAATFGATSDHSGFGGDISYVGANANVLVNTASNQVFMGAQNTLRVRAASGSLQLNTANVFRGSLALEGANGFTLIVNQNQPNLSTLTLGSGTLVLTIGSGVSSIWFANNSNAAWSTGSISITNFRNRVLRFGTDAQGLSTNQLAQINTGGGSAYLTSEGYLKATNSTWNGTSWSVIPTSTDDAIITNNYNAGSLEVNDLMIRSGATVSIAAGQTLKINGELINLGTLNIASGGSLVTMGKVLGQATISRNTTFADDIGKYSIIGSPVVGATTSNLGSVVYAYREDVAFGGERFFRVTSPEIMSAGEGYFSAFTGDVTFSGVPNTGDIEVSLIYNAAQDGGTGNAGFNLVANPYPAAIDYSALVNVTANPDIDATVYIWDDGGSDLMRRSNADYITINSMGIAGPTSGSGRANDWNGHIGSAQGFFVKANKAGTLHFTNAMKVSGHNADGNFFRNLNNELERIAITLSTSNHDQKYTTLLGFAADATTAHDRQYDAAKLSGIETFGVYTFMGQQTMAIQGLPVFSEELAIALGFTVEAEGRYLLNFESSSALQGYSIILQDHLLGTEVELSEQGTYAFASEPTKGNTNRFELKLSPRKVLNVTSAELFQIRTSKESIEIASQNDRRIGGELTISDLQGKMHLVHLLDATMTKVSIPFAFKKGQLYLINYRNESNTYIQKLWFTE